MYFRYIRNVSANIETDATHPTPHQSPYGDSFPSRGSLQISFAVFFRLPLEGKLSSKRETDEVASDKVKF